MYCFELVKVAAEPKNPQWRRLGHQDYKNRYNSPQIVLELFFGYDSDAT